MRRSCTRCLKHLLPPLAVLRVPDVLDQLNAFGQRELADLIEKGAAHSDQSASNPPHAASRDSPLAAIAGSRKKLRVGSRKLASGVSTSPLRLREKQPRQPDGPEWDVRVDESDRVDGIRIPRFVLHARLTLPKTDAARPYPFLNVSFTLRFGVSAPSASYLHLDKAFSAARLNTPGSVASGIRGATTWPCRSTENSSKTQPSTPRRTVRYTIK